MQMYIKGIGCISPQETFDNKSFLENITEYKENVLRCITPNYKEYIRPLDLRRMSKIMRMGLVSAMISLEDAGIEHPDAIITGTGMGCIEDTEVFLTSVIDNKEKLLTPTAFIRSTHNTVGAQIAVHLKCHNYNYSYVHKGFSFESALLDSQILLMENEASNVLVGGIDETSENHFTIMGKLDYWKNEKISNLELLSNDTQGSIAGEGSTFFVIGKEPGDNPYGKIDAMFTFSNPKSSDYAVGLITEFLNDNDVKQEDIDLMVLGMSGDSETDLYYKALKGSLSPEINGVYYKHLCGEYHTSSAFGLWISANILKRNYIPKILMIKPFQHKEINKILLYNHFRNEQHSVILLSK